MTRRALFAAIWTFLLTLAVSPAFAQNVRLVAKLHGGNEAPNKVLTGAFGDAECVYEVGPQDITCTGTVFNLPTGATAGHIHVGADGVAGPTVCPATFTPNVTNDFTFTLFCTPSNITLRPDQGIRSWDDFVQAVVGENTYVNIHTRVNPGGEIRGPLLIKK